MICGPSQTICETSRSIARVDFFSEIDQLIEHQKPINLYLYM